MEEHQPTYGMVKWSKIHTIILICPACNVGHDGLLVSLKSFAFIQVQYSCPLPRSIFVIASYCGNPLLGALGNSQWPVWAV